MQSRFAKLVNRFALIIAIFVLWLGYVEVAAYARLRLANPETDIIPRSRLEAAYQNATWVNTLANEWRPSNQFDYRAYTVWERRPFAGKTIQVERDGVRFTDHSQCDADAYTIWIFGGSTVWGAGVPDWLTIPSLLAEQYEKNGRKVCVRNYGEKAWVNTQELVKLVLELKGEERKPNLVLFYDGPSDVYATYQSGRPGVHQNFDEMKQVYEGHAAEGRGSFQYLLKSNAAQLLLGHRLGNQMGKRGTSQNAELIAKQTVRCYLENADMIAALAREYRFDYAFFWEPTIHNADKPLSPDEQRSLVAANLHSPGLEKADREARVLIDAQPHPHLYDIANVFDQVHETIYFDQAHVSAEGNRLVAQRIYETVAKPQ